MKKLIRLTVINAGGEFTAGVIDDQEIKDKLRKKIDEGSVNTFMEFDDETYFEASNYTNILHQYGPNVPGSVIMTEESFDVDTEDDYDRNYEEISSDDIDDTDVKRFTSSNPYPEGGTSGYAQDDLIFYSQKIEKRIHYPVVIEALLHKAIMGRNSPDPRRSYATATVSGVPSCVKRLSNATRTCNSAT